jgi:hypothetical protein
MFIVNQFSNGIQGEKLVLNGLEERPFENLAIKPFSK